jgi:ribosome recycling factor
MFRAPCQFSRTSSCDMIIPITNATKTDTMSSGIMTIVLSTTKKMAKVYTLSVSDFMLDSVDIVSIITNRTISLTPQITEAASGYLNIQTWPAGMIVDVRTIVRDFDLSLVHDGSGNLGPVLAIKGRGRSVTAAMRDAEQIAEAAAMAFVCACRDVRMEVRAGRQMWRVRICDEGCWFRGRGAVARIRVGRSVLIGHFFVGLEVAPKLCYAAIGIVILHVHRQTVQLSC